ncbi:MAG: hypothetical protein HC936_03870 [Leptolyngbyaceae cyanobacterium SU_3_3]|nr:hypothetical protein [Leptolyngbyaceae cyanobacterium SU_3_3]NJR50382.1 hypothetical protein [Leptolyngbyaceae cyanobacterium CSU_1_3]
MSPRIVFPLLAQTAPKTTKTKPAPTATIADSGQQTWMMATGGLFLLLVILGVFSTIQAGKLKKQVKFETFKNREMQKKLKYAVETISKMERNPDLIHSREFNLDYLRMRMAEEVFHFAIVNQIKIKVKDKITLALRPGQGNQGEIGIASTGRQVDEIFDVEYDAKDAGGRMMKRVLFRIQIKILKLPTQPTSVTINQIIDCFETFLSPSHENETWQPAVQGRIANMRWDQKAKPTPLLVLEQTQEGSNVTFRTNRMAGKS